MYTPTIISQLADRYEKYMPEMTRADQEVAIKVLLDISKKADPEKQEMFQDILEAQPSEALAIIQALFPPTAPQPLYTLTENRRTLVQLNDWVYQMEKDYCDMEYDDLHKNDKIEEIGIDIETYSDIDLTKCGVYKYAESPNFQVLLFAYSINNGPVRIVDIAGGEVMPKRLLDALTDPGVVKTAYNAAFERICLSRFLGLPALTYLDPAQWDCTMVRAAGLGMPLSLDQCGQVLGCTKQKMKEGKALIRYFSLPCKSTKVNGGRTRNLPEHAPEKWATFKEYCIRDVEVEQAIRAKVVKKPVTAKEQRLWQVDQRINDRGVMVDLQMATEAKRLDEEYKKELIEEATELTGSDNPNSVSQLKAWLEKEEGVKVTSLNKKDMPDLVDSIKGEKAQRVLQIRQELGKKSTKKYTAMINCACKDSRVRGLTQFYGANRTGRWCVTGDHEILTPEGWVRLDEWKGGKIATWNISTEVISFQQAKANEFDYDGEMYQVESKRCALICTPEHKVPYWTDHGWDADEIQNLEKRHSIPFWGRSQSVTGNLDDDQLRILIMTQADGHYTPESLRFHFRKERKIQRCKTLLRRGDIVFTIESHGDGTNTISIKNRHLPLYLRMFRDKTFGTWMLKENADVVFDEIEHWDGYRVAANSTQYATCNKKNADIIQALAVLNGRSATMIKKHEYVENWSTSYVLNIWRNPGVKHDIRKEYISRIPYQGKVYCPTTPTGFFLVRRNGKCWITGNSGRLLQLQNLPQNHIPDLEFARDLIKSGDLEELEMNYRNVPQTLSELIRTALIAKPGCTFHVCDFSAIEARVIAWLANQTWVLDTFKAGGDIYCATASQMFGVPVEKHGRNAELRQKGKIAVLALGYQGAEGALEAMGGERMGLTKPEMTEIKDKWRAANPKIVRLWKHVETAAQYCVESHEKCKIEKGITFEWAWGGVKVTLPSGRFIYYPRMRMGEENGQPRLVYDGVNHTTKAWGPTFTYGGKMTENIVQAIARDCLAETMLRLDEAGYHIVFHVHDECIIEATPDQKLEDIETIFGLPIPWAEGLPLNGAGYTTPFYKKD